MTHDAQVDRRDLPWPSGLPIVSGDWRGFALNADSRSVPVGAPSRDLLWIPSRTPLPAEAPIDALFAESRGEAVDIERIEAMEHSTDYSPESGKDTQ